MKNNLTSNVTGEKVIYKSESSFIEVQISDDTSGTLDNVYSIPDNSDTFQTTVSLENTVSVFDAAVYLLQKIGKCSTMKLHKLLYYCQAWSLVWDEEPLFKEKIEAWANGPVIRKLFNYHRGLFSVVPEDFLNGNPDALSEIQKETIDSIIEHYGNKSAQWLINLTHVEDPWKKARIGLELMERGDNEITLESMAEYYSSL